MQKFKGDEKELRFIAVGDPVISDTSTAKTEFFDGAYAADPLGDLLWLTGRAPLSSAIPQNIFRRSFEALFNSFEFAGSFESYLTVFRQVFGEDVEVEFTVPGPGKLQIEITALGFEISNLVARYISENQYFFDEIITQDGIDQIIVSTVKGFQTEYELNQMLFEMVPAGIFTTIILQIGEP